jgi:hypothetical protein
MNQNNEAPANKEIAAQRQKEEDAKNHTLVWMPSKTIAIEAWLMQEAISGFQMATGIAMTIEGMAAFLEEVNLACRLKEYNECDTTLRDDMADAIADKLLGRSWPTHGDKGGAREFFKEFKAAAISAGYNTGIDEE